MKRFFGKKLLAWCMTALMLVSMSATAVLGVSAAPDTDTDIALGETLTVVLTEDQTTEYLRFIPEEDGYYRFYSSGDMDVYGVLLDAYDDVLHADDDSGEALNFDFTYYLYAGEVYYLSLSIYADGTGTFDVTVVVADDTGEEPDESEAIEIAVGETMDVIASSSADYQEFWFYPETDGWYEFVSYGSCDTMVYVSAAQGVNNDNDGADRNYRAVAYCYADDVCIFETCVSDEDGGTYQVTVNALEEDALFPDATTIEVGSTAEVTRNDGDDNVVYRFTPDVSGVYCFYTTGDEDTYCYLYDVAYAHVGRWDDYYFVDNYNCVISGEFIAGETYYFLLSAYPNGGGFVSFDVHLQEGEYPDLRAGEICAGDTQTVYPDHPEMDYYYAFIPEESGWYRTELGVDGYLSATWCDSEGLFVVEGDNGSEEDDFYVIVYMQGGEVYYLALSTYGEDVPMYTVTVTAAEEDSLFLDAIDIRADQTVAVEGEQCFRFVPTVTGAYTFYSTGSWDTYCDLYDATAGTKERYDDTVEEYNFSLTHSMMAGQTYYFYVDSYGDDPDPYSVTLLFEEAVAVVDHIAIGGLRAPEVGETVADYYESLYGLTTDPELALDDMAVFMGDYWMENSETFEADCIYTVGLAFGEIENGVIFADGYTVTTNVGESVEVEYFDGYAIVWVTITASEEEPDLLLGDVDGNGRVNNRDLGYLQQYLNDWGVVIDEAVCDMDGNGRVNNRDLGALQQLLNQ